MNMVISRDTWHKHQEVWWTTPAKNNDTHYWNNDQYIWKKRKEKELDRRPHVDATYPIKPSASHCAAHLSKVGCPIVINPGRYSDVRESQAASPVVRRWMRYTLAGGTLDKRIKTHCPLPSQLLLDTANELTAQERVKLREGETDRERERGRGRERECLACVCVWERDGEWVREKRRWG